MKEHTGTILIVEDEEHDVEFLTRAFRNTGTNNPVQAVTNGEEAMAYLAGENPYHDRVTYPFPHVVVTDLKMPRMGGLELLRWIHANPKYRVVPTIVLTSSTSQSDVDAAFACGASAYIVKPVGFEELKRVAQTIAEYWRLSLTPKREA